MDRLETAPLDCLSPANASQTVKSGAKLDRALFRPPDAVIWRVATDIAAFLLALTVVRAFATPALAVAEYKIGAAAGALPVTAVAQGALLASGVGAYLAAFGHYHRRMPLSCEVQQVLGAAVFGLLLNGALAFAFKSETPRLAVVTTWVLFPLAVLVLRWLSYCLLDAAGLWRIPVLVVGSDENARLTAEVLESERRLGYTVAACVDATALTAGADEPNGEADRLRHLLWRHGARLLVLEALDRDGGYSAEQATVLCNLQRHAVPVAVMTRTSQALGRSIPLSSRRTHTRFTGHDLVLVFHDEDGLRLAARATKVGFDVTAAALLLLFLAPVFLTISGAIRFLDGCCAIYAHPRVGAGGRRFACLKFQSMVQDGDALLKDVLRSDPAAAAEWAATHKLRNDPRVTRIGKLLRRSSLDELPQLLNVLRLQMSLVGPRPIVESEVARYGDKIGYYHQTRPGLTGLWQVSGRSETTYAWRVQLDTWYAQNWSLWQDAVILARTLPVVIKRRGAV